jgi:hypothetical protein
MTTSVLILITDGKGKGRLEIDGRLDLLGRFLHTINKCNNEREFDIFSQTDSAPSKPGNTALNNQTHGVQNGNQ